MRLTTIRNGLKRTISTSDGLGLLHFRFLIKIKLAMILKPHPTNISVPPLKSVKFFFDHILEEILYLEFLYGFC